MSTQTRSPSLSHQSTAGSIPTTDLRARVLERIRRQIAAGSNQGVGDLTVETRRTHKLPPVGSSLATAKQPTTSALGSSSPLAQVDPL